MTEHEAFKIYRLIFILRNMVNYYSRLYYQIGESGISDGDFDTLWDKLVELEGKHKWSVIPESPTQKINDGIQKGFKKIKHLRPMYSLKKVKTEKAFLEWDKSMQNLLKDIK